MLLVYLLLCMFTASMIIVKDRAYNQRLSLSLMLLSINILYTFFGYLFILENSSSSLTLSTFFIIQTTSMMGVLMSILIFKGPDLKHIPERKELSSKSRFFFFLIAVVHFLFYVKHYGGVSNILTEGYSLVTEGDDNNFFSFSAFGFLASFVLYFKSDSLVILFSIFFFILSMLLGTRGIAIVFLSIPLISYYLFHKRFSYFKIIYFIPLFLFFSLTAYIRNIGFSNIRTLTSLDIDFFRRLIISNNEFSTTGLVVSKGLDNIGWYDKSFLEYIIGIISSIIPKGLWATRPEAISNIFSQKFAPSGEGIGFSVGFEGYMFFGYLGSFIYFFVFQSYLTWISYASSYNKRIMLIFMPLIIFWINRIDVQTCFKVSLIYFGFATLWKLIIKLLFVKNI